MTAHRTPITIYHSPDADDAFMFYGLSSGAVRDERFDLRHELSDIQTLNERTLKGELDFTAISVHAYAHLREPYYILNCGASFGGPEYGPRLIAREEFDLTEKRTRKIALPGALTSATLALRIFLMEQGIPAKLANYPFDEVQEAVRRGEVDAGLIIHEGQLTSEREGFTVLLDLGRWWWKKHNLPLPLGVNVVKASIGEEIGRGVSDALRRSIEHSLANREAALTYALQYGRGISIKDADEFCKMYVNDRTIDMGKDGRSSIRLFLKAGYDLELITNDVKPIFL